MFFVLLPVPALSALIEQTWAKPSSSERTARILLSNVIWNARSVRKGIDRDSKRNAIQGTVLVYG